jgi:hypothetical protein
MYYDIIRGMNGKPVEQEKCSGVIFSRNGMPEVDNDLSDYSGRVTGTIAPGGELNEITFCSELQEDGKCRTDNVMCPVPLLRR